MHICAWKVCIHGLLTDLCLSSDSEWEPCSVVILSNQPEQRFTLYAQIWDWYCYYITLHWVLRNTPWCLFLSVREIKKQTTSTENVRPPQLGINVHLHSCLFLMLASPLQIFCFKTECTFHLLCLQSHGHLVSCTRFLSVWVSLSLSPSFFLECSGGRLVLLISGSSQPSLLIPAPTLNIWLVLADLLIFVPSYFPSCCCKTDTYSFN